MLTNRQIERRMRDTLRRYGFTLHKLRGTDYFIIGDGQPMTLKQVVSSVERYEEKRC